MKLEDGGEKSRERGTEKNFLLLFQVSEGTAGYFCLLDNWMRQLMLDSGANSQTILPPDKGRE